MKSLRKLYLIILPTIIVLSFLTIKRAYNHNLLNTGLLIENVEALSDPDLDIDPHAYKERNVKTMEIWDDNSKTTVYKPYINM